MRFALLTLLLSACGDDPGAAPTISELDYAPATLTAGVQGRIDGTLRYTDADADPAQLGIEVVLPDQTRQTLPMADLQGQGTATEGTITWAVVVAPPQPGEYRFFLWIEDAAGHESNRLEGSLDVR